MIGSGLDPGAAARLRSGRSKLSYSFARSHNDERSVQQARQEKFWRAQPEEGRYAWGLKVLKDLNVGIGSTDVFNTLHVHIV